MFYNKELKSAFGMMDTNHDGKLNPSEIRTVIKKVNADLSEYDLNELISSLDADNDGKVDFQGNGANTEVNIDLLFFSFLTK